MEPDLKFWLGFNLVKGIGPAKLRALLDYFGSIEQAWQATPMQLATIGIDRRTINSFIQTREKSDLDAALAEVEKANVRLVCWDSAEYPTYLRSTPTPPPVYYIKGDITEADKWAIAIVGTRRLTAYGRQLTREITSGLVKRGVTIVSGLARGIDSIAHETALDMGGRTIAILGSGLNHIYPTENKGLAQRIMAGQGAVISEYPLNAQPEGKNFPPRNRIISGLSLGTVVIEAAQKSGALITAKFAQEQERTIYALPGNVNNVQSKGTNQLIQDGAKLITCAEDVLNDLNLHDVVEHQAVQLALPDSAEEAALLPHLMTQPVHVDDLSRSSGLPTALVSSTLTLMELKGVVEQVGGMQYVLVRENDAEYLTGE